MSKNGNSIKETLQSFFATGAILIAFAISVIIFKFVMGNPVNFEGLNPDGHPLPGNYLGMVYKGGYIVPLLIMLLLTAIIFSIERAITLGKAKGKMRLNVFVRNLQKLISENKLDEAIASCDIQKGSLANVMKSALHRYKELEKDELLTKDQKVIALQKELEEATALELPMLSKNLSILSTIASVAVLTGLIGTVLGMIKAFSALATAGAPDALALATGISEALINTAFGVSGSAISIVFFNYFSNKIDQLTFKIDEAGFSVVQTFASRVRK